MSDPLVECKLAGHEARNKVGGPFDPIIVGKLVHVIDHKATGEKARLYRKAKRFSLRQVAKEMKLSPPFLSDLERGNRNWTHDNARLYLTAICNLEIQRLQEAVASSRSSPALHIG